MIEIIINQKKISVDEGTTILAVTDSLGIKVPRLCNHKILKPYGACRMCVVEVLANGKKEIRTSCNHEIHEPVEVFTDSENALNARRGVIEMHLARWPNVPAIKALAKINGVEKPRYEHPLKNESKDACVLCGRCVRVCSEGIWENIITFAGRGAERKVSMPFDKFYERCLGCGACAWVCPTGAIKVTNEANHPARPKTIRNWGMKVTSQMITLDDQQCRMRRIGTGNLVEIMDDYDLLPTLNYQYGGHENVKKINSRVWQNEYFTQGLPDGCWQGCTMSCSHAIEKFEIRTGPYKSQKVLVDGPEYETIAGCGSNIGIFDPHYIAELNFYCDTYGIDTISFGTALAFAMECFENGILKKEHTGGLELKFGNGDAALEILHQMSRGEGFGMILGKGIRNMKKLFADEYGGDPDSLNDIGMENKGLEFSEYVTKESLAQQGGYCMTNKGAQHDEAWLIFMDQVNNQIPTFEDKAEALHYFPLFRTWFGLMGLCKLPWNDVSPADNAQTDEPHKIPEHVEGYCNYFTGMTGIDLDPDKLIRMSEKVYNFQRVFNLRLGYGTREHDSVPYRAMGPVTKTEYESRQERYDKQLEEKLGIDPSGMSTDEKRAKLRKYREDQYRQLQDAVYNRRGWNSNGVPKLETLKELGIDFPDVVEIVKQHPDV
ncbi:MAG: aldehyde ferredoxin oxidoreductase C-terminal domain-containing protein [bacterium]